jgi:hypothetical protein
MEENRVLRNLSTVKVTEVINDESDHAGGQRSEPRRRGQWRARRHGMAGIYGNHGIVESVTYRT